MKKTILLSLFILPFSIYAQNNNSNDTHISKSEQIESKNGFQVKKYKFPLNRIKTFTLVLTPTIIKYEINNEISYFYNLKKLSADDINIEYKDLLEIQKYIGLLKTELNKDLNSNTINKENKYITNDFFEVGYSIDDKSKSYWYIRNRYILNSFERFDKADVMDLFENSINEGIIKIEELRKTNSNQ